LGASATARRGRPNLPPPPPGRSLRLLRRLAVLLLLCAGCPASDPVERLVAQLGDAARREQAIDGLLVLVKQAPKARRDQVKKRVVYALMEAYREDKARPQIVTALALLRDPRAEEVFVAALKDAERGGAHFEAAVRSTRIIGELRLKRTVPVMVSALERALKAPRQDRNTWLERSLVSTLERIEDRQAVPVLIKALQADPALVDFYVSRLAARALGRLRDPKAVKPLVDALGATRHGLLLYEESRRALCRIGSPSVEALLAAVRKLDQRSQRSRAAARAQRTRHVAAALSVLGDLGQAEPLAGLAFPKGPMELRLALGETRLRLEPGGLSEGRPAEDSTTLPAQRPPVPGEAALAILADGKANISSRRRAAELLGWHGKKGLLPLLRPACMAEGPAKQLLCLSVALAYSRAGERLEPLDKLLAAMQDRVSRRQLQVYRARLVVKEACKQQPKCYEDKLTNAKDWRERERAALELGRLAAPASQPHVAVVLARRLSEEHPQVRRAILVSLERMAPRLTDDARGEVRELLAQTAKDVKPHGATPPGLVSRATCLGERLRRTGEDREKQ
jgi:HEAT repeat protein